MAVTDVTIHRNGTPTPELNNTTMTKIPFDVQVEQDAIFTMDAGNDDIDCSEAGHYLVGYSLHSQTAAAVRHAMRGAILINGTEPAGQYGSVSSYNRNGTNDKIYLNASSIVDLAANDDIAIGSIRIATNTNAHPLTANRAGVWIVKLSDTAAYLRARGPSGSQTLTQTDQTFINLNLATNDEVDTGFTHSAASADITIADAGLYLVSYNFKITSPGNGRIEVLGHLTLDGTILNQSRSARNLRFDNGTTNVNLAATCIVRTASANQILRIQAAQEFQTAPTSGPTVDEVAITIMKFESDVDVLRQFLAPTGTQEANPSAATVIDYDAPTEIDSATFTEVGGRVTCVKAGHYFFTANITSERTDVGSGTRQTQSIRVRKDATALQWGGGGAYNRGNQGSEDTFISGSMSNVLTDDLTANQIIDFTVQQEGDTGVGTLDIQRGGMTAFRIEDLDAGPTVVTEEHTTDSVLQEIDNELTHTTDSFLKKTQTLTHTTDSFLQATQTLSHTTDSFLRATQTLTHTTDSVLKAQQTLDHTTDSILQRIDNELTHTTDSLLQPIITLTHTTDSVLKAQQTLTHTTDSTLQRIDNLLTHTTDSFLKAQQILTHTTDSVLRGQELRTHTTDSVLRAIQTLTHTTDSFLNVFVELTHTTDSVLKAIDTILTHTTDSVLQATQTLTHTTDSVLKASQTITHTTDSVLKAIDSLRTHTTDSLLEAIEAQVRTLTHTTDSLLQAVFSLTHTTDSHLLLQVTKIHTTDSVLQATLTLTHTTDSILQRIDNLLTHTTDSHLNITVELTHTTDSFLTGTFTLNHTTDSVLKRIGDIRTHLTDSVLQRIDNLRIHTTDSFLSATFTLSHTTDSVLKKIITLIHTTDSLLREKRTISHTTDSVLRKVITLSHTTDSILIQVLALTHTTDSFINVPGGRLHTTDSFLQAFTKVPQPFKRITRDILTFQRVIRAVLRFQ